MNELRIAKIRIALEKLEKKLGTRANLCTYAQLNKNAVDAGQIAIFENVLFDTPIPGDVIKEKLGDEMIITGEHASILQCEANQAGKTTAEFLTEYLAPFVAESEKRNTRIRELLSED